MSGKRTKLTALQQRFADQLLLDPLDAAKAYVRAGGKPKAAKQNAYHMLQVKKVQAYLQRRRAARAVKLEVKQDAVLEDLEGFRRLTVHDFFEQDPTDDAPRMRPLSEIQGPAAKFIKRIKTTRKTFLHKDGTCETQIATEVTLHDILRVEEMIGRHLGIWKEQLHLHLHRSDDLVGKSDEQLEKEINELKEAEVTGVRTEPKRIEGG